MNGIESIAAERKRQIEAEGWTPEHDDEHDLGELARAGGAYALHAGVEDRFRESDDYEIAHYWPFDRAWWKPRSRREDLVRAGALIAAEIDRIDRAAAKS